MRDIFLNLILFLPFLVSVFWAVTLFLRRKENVRPQNIWIGCLIAVSFCSFTWGIILRETENHHLYYILDIIDVTFTLLLLPFVYFYFWSLTHKKKFSWKQYIWLAPGLLTGGVVTLTYWLMDSSVAEEYMWAIIENYNIFQFEPGSLQWINFLAGVYVYGILLCIQITIVMTYSTLNLIRYKKGLTNFFSSLDKKSIVENYVVLTGIYILEAIGLAAIALWSFSVEQYLFLKYFFMAGYGIVLYSVSFHVTKIRFSATEFFDESEKIEDKTSNYTELNEAFIRMLPQFNRLMDNDKIFLEPNITLDDIARRMNSNRSYISRLINENFTCTFYEFINCRRIEFAKKIITENPAYTQEQIANMSGFTHTSTFSRTFKRLAGITFKEWQKSVNK